MSQEQYERRKKILVEYYRRHRYLPTYEEVRKLFGLKSKSPAYEYVRKMIDDGLVAKSPDGRLIPTSKLYELRVLGPVQAGFPTPAEEELADTISLDELLVDSPNSTYVLIVNGDSMIEAGINEGDMVLVDRKKIPHNNDIVIARIGNEWTMKYLIQQKGKIILRPANKKYKDIIPDDEMTIAGVVVGLVRKY